MPPKPAADQSEDVPEWFHPMAATLARAKVSLDSETLRASCEAAEECVRSLWGNRLRQPDTACALPILLRREFFKSVAGVVFHTRIATDLRSSTVARDKLRALRAAFDEAVVVREDDPEGRWFDPRGWEILFSSPPDTALFFQAAAEVLVRHEQKLSNLGTDALHVARLIASNLAPRN